jgi:tetratricopeptide (TPR) repeat protein
MTPEKLIHARLSFMDNRHKEAKIALEETQIKIEQKFPEFPLSLAAESIRTMLDLGDYEEAIKVKETVDVQGKKLDSNLEYSINSVFNKLENKQTEYTKHNKNGLTSYNEGKYRDAYESFTKARALSPMNIGVRLNLLQCIIKLFHISDDDNTSIQLHKECGEHYHYINNMPLRDIYQQKFASMKLDAESAMAV